MASAITSSDVTKMKPGDIKKNAKLTAAIFAWAKSRSITENWFFLFDKGNMAAVHPKYVRAGAPREVNISGDLRGRMQEQFDQGNEAEWKKLLKDAKGEIWALCKINMQGFDTHDAVVKMNRDLTFDDVVAGFKKKSGAKALKLLGIDKKHLEALATVMAHNHFGETTEATKLLKKIDKAIKYDDMIKALQKSSLI